MAPNKVVAVDKRPGNILLLLVIFFFFFLIWVKHTLHNDATENKRRSFIPPAPPPSLWVNWHSHLFPRYYKYYILYIAGDVWHKRAYVGVFNEISLGSGGEERGRSCCQTHNFAFAQRQLIKDLSDSTWLWINLASLLPGREKKKKLVSLFPSPLSPSLRLFIGAWPFY